MNYEPWTPHNRVGGAAVFRQGVDRHEVEWGLVVSCSISYNACQDDRNGQKGYSKDRARTAVPFWFALFRVLQPASMAFPHCPGAPRALQVCTGFCRISTRVLYGSVGF